MTGLESVSLAAGNTGRCSKAWAISIEREYEDEDDNHYFNAFKES